MIYLADANLLVASVVTSHVFHAAARKWFEARPDFATTPITELALVRVATHRNYGLSFSDAMTALKSVQELSNHVFWPADLEVSRTIFKGAIPSASTTDAYLLALAKNRGARLATFDQGILKIAAGLESYIELLIA